MHIYTHTYIICKTMVLCHLHTQCARGERPITQTQTIKKETPKAEVLTHSHACVTVSSGISCSHGAGAEASEARPTPLLVSSPQAEAPAPPAAGAPGAPSPSSGPGSPASHRGSTPRHPGIAPGAGEQHPRQPAAPSSCPATAHAPLAVLTQQHLDVLQEGLNSKAEGK